MSGNDSASPEFWSLVNDLLSGALGDSGVNRLEQLLMADAELRVLFRKYCQLHINLDAEIRAQRAVDHWHDQRSLQTTIEPQKELKRAVRSRRSSVAWLTIVCSAAAILFVLAGYVARDHVANQDAPGESLMAAADSDLDVITVRLSSTESRYLPIGDVGNIHVQGPAHLELFGTTRARLHEGRIKVRITDPRGRGFVVETPQGNVTDLGTEFGVDVTGKKNTGVVVFEGSVDLAVAGSSNGDVQHLRQGEGVKVGQKGQLDRIMSIVTGDVSTFGHRGERRPNGVRPVILDVADNIRALDLRKFYEIVPGGLHEDALAYVDRPAHDWSGMAPNGMPAYLVGADYVKPFNSDKMRSDVKLFVTLGCASRLFVFADDRVQPPQWLRENFRDTGDDIGIDVGRYELDGEKFYRLDRGFGPGVSVDARCSVWERVISKPMTVELGPNSGSSELTAMYGIAAVRLLPTQASDEKPAAEPRISEGSAKGAAR